MFSKMKQSSNNYKQTGKLTQYSSGEDDSGTEDIFTQKDFVFSGYLHRPIDLKQKKTLTPASNLRQNRLRRTGMIDTPVLSVTPTRIETSTIRKTSTRFVSPTLLPNSTRTKFSAGKNSVVRHRSPVFRARLWSERNSDSSLVDERGTLLDSEISQKTRVLCETSDQVPSSSGSTNDNIHSFPRHGSLKKSDNCRRVLSDITKETVTDFRFQFPSYFSRDVLPLDADVNSKSDDLLSTKDRSENSFLKNDTSNYDEPSANGIPTGTRSTFSNSVDVSKEFKTIEEKGWFSLHYQKVSMILVVIVLLFFFGVGLLYLNVRFKDAQKNLSLKYESKYPVCDSSAKHQVVSCIREDQLNVVTSLFESITPQLMAVASDSLCNSSGRSISVTDKDVLDYIQNTNSVNREDAENLLQNLKILVLSNPHWDVAVVHDLPLEDGSGSESHRNEIFHDNLLRHGRLVFRNPLVPFSCQLKLWFKTFLTWVSSFTAVCIVVTGVLVALWDYKRRGELHRQEVYTLVNKIINTVRNHHRRMQAPGADGTPFITVDDCRNEIVSSQHSNYLSSAWDEAVRFIDVHESRILTEVQVIHGKTTKVWQWCAAPQPSEICPKPNNMKVNMTPVEPNNSPTSTSFIAPAHSSSSWATKCRRNKVWQGKAFETIAGSPNSLPCSPTPCLKIRHMFDPDLEHGDDWPILIQDSILEKCEDVNVLHLFIDCSSQEGCVFMKCSSSEEAGKAYRALHGWWFDTKLVTVKYLRTERYHERFPEAVNASSPLRPSNNQRLSLQELWHFPLEST